MKLNHTERALLCWSLERSLLQAEPEETEALELLSLLAQPGEETEALELLLLRLSGSASPYAPFSSAELWRCAELSR